MGSLFSGPKIPAPPPIKKPAPMPDMAALKTQGQRAAALQAQQGSRSSTVLSDASYGL